MLVSAFGGYYKTTVASIYRRKGSPYWWLQHWPGGKRKCASTGLRTDSAEETRQAELIAAEWSLREERARSLVTRRYSWDWVDLWIDSRKSAQTVAAYRHRWKHVRHWMRTRGISDPSQISYKHVEDYIGWRTTESKGRKPRGRNTAIAEIKLLGTILGEARDRGELSVHPWPRLRLHKTPPPEKPELSNEQIGQCLQALKLEPEWLRLTFLIALYTGCRLRETRLDMQLVDFDRGTITFPAPKGGRARAFTRPLPTELRPHLEAINDGRRFSHDFPFQPSRAFQHFFRRVGMEGFSVHCLRVTYITRLLRGGVAPGVAMRLVNHSSEMVHRMYQRIRVDDLMPFADAVSFAPAGATTPRNQPGESAFRREEIADLPTSDEPSRSPQPARKQAPAD